MLPIPTHLKNFSNAKTQRYIKLHHDEAMKLTGKKYDYVIYIDGSARITCDIKPLVYSLIESRKNIAIHRHRDRNCIYDEAAICVTVGILKYDAAKEQMDFYKSEEMPEKFGLLENPVIIRKTGDEELNAIMQTWWEQIERFTHRDQLSLPYALWKHGKNIDYVFSLGTNVWRNHYFLFYGHEKRGKNHAH